jgi:hypothetical protein
VTRLLADHADVTGPSNDLALLTHWLDAGANFHVVSFSNCLERELFVAVGDAAASHVVGRNLNLDLVAGQNTDAVHAHFPRTVSENGVPVLQFDTEHRVGKWLDDGTLYGERVFLWLTQVLSPCYGTATWRSTELLDG